MAFKRTFRRKKRVFKRRRNYRKRMYGRISRPLGMVHTFVRSLSYNAIITDAVVPQYGGYNFRLSDLPNYTEFTNLFDEYMVYKVTLQCIPTKIVYNTNTTQNIPHFCYAVDKDDSTAPTSLNEIMEYSNVKINPMTKRLRISFRPRYSVAVYNGVSNGYGSRVGWLDCANAGVPHYGWKYVAGPSLVSSTFAYNVWATYVIKCRGTR